MSLDFLAQNSDQIRDFFIDLIILVGLVALVLFVQGCRETRRYRSGLRAMERWEKSNSNFNLEEETEQSPEDVIKEAQHPLAVRWLEHFRALHRQNKAPDVDGLIGSIEHELARRDEAFRSLTSSLILLGLLGTFVGLIIVVIPIPGIIQGAQISPTLSQEVKIEDVFSTILEGLGQSVSGMPLAFITSIIGLFSTLVLNGLYSFLLLRPRNKLLSDMEACFNVKIAPKFAVIPPQLRLSRVFTQTVNDLYDKYFTALSEYLDKRLKEIVDSNARMVLLVEEGGTKLKESSEASLKSAEILEQHKNTVAAGAKEIMRAAMEFSRHIENFERLSEPLNALKGSVDTMLKENERLMARQLQAFDERMDKQSKSFESRMETLGDGLAETLETIRGLNDIDYRPNFTNIQNLLIAVRESQDALLEFQIKTLDEQGEAFERANQPVQNGLEGLRQDLKGLSKATGALQNQLDQMVGAINQGFKKTDEDLQVLKAIDQVIPQLADMHATAQAIEKQLDSMAKSPQVITVRPPRNWGWLRRLLKKDSKE
jgi:biopolymer transport protein ExbB/TolQ/methyl-accepting chemotaxis protein